jgi:hypothetical protein
MKAIRRSRRLLRSSVFAGLVIAIGCSIYAPRVAAQDGKPARPSPPVSQSSSGANSPNINVGGNLIVNPPPDRTPPTIYLGCEIAFLPIRIPPASTIHVLRLSPSIMSGFVRAQNQNVPGAGALVSIDSPGDQALDWPSEGHDGRWMNRADIEKLEKSNQFALPFAAKCKITSYGTDTLEDTVVTIVVMTSDNKEHDYPLKFDPLVQNQPLTFYIVDLCSTGVYPKAVTWVPSLTTRVMGRGEKQVIPLKFDSKEFPSSLSYFGQPSAFLWNGMAEACKDW